MITGNPNQDKLIKRFSDFAVNCVKFVKLLSRTEENRIYGRQLIRSSSSVGANYTEASAAASRKDFTNDVNRARKEARESLYWLGLLKRINPKRVEEADTLIKECEELAKILTTIVKKSKE